VNLNETKQLRLFFALWPNEDIRDSLAQINHKLARQCLGKPMRPENLHITLAFPGNLPVTSLDYLLPMADAISFKPFKLKLDYLGIFPRAHIIWAGMKTEPVELLELAAELHTGILTCGFQLDSQPFKPHLTLLRNAKRLPEQTIKPLYWKVDDYCLISSMSKPDGVQYKVLHRWS